MTDHALDALLAEYVAPPVPAGLAGRVAAAALALPQEPRLAYARRAGAAPKRDRRGKWLRRPLLLGSVALGLAVSGAVAATLAGIRLDRLPIVEAVLAELPFLDRGTPPELVPPPRMAPPQAPPALAPPPAQERRIAAQWEAEPPVPRSAAPRDDAPPVAAPIEAPRRPDAAAPRLIEFPPPAPALPPASVPREETIASTPAPESRAPAPNAAEATRLQQERIERTERLRASRQAQIERLQRIQERRERIRRLRRD